MSLFSFCSKMSKQKIKNRCYGKKEQRKRSKITTRRNFNNKVGFKCRLFIQNLSRVPKESVLLPEATISDAINIHKG